jgi:hypothetical protein
MLREDNTGFVNFPIPGKVIDRIEGFKTFIYLVAFETLDLTNIPYVLSNCRLKLQGTLVSDDVTFRKRFSHNTLDDIVEEQLDNNEFEIRYFPNVDDEIQSSIPLTTSDLKDELRLQGLIYLNIKNHLKQIIINNKF